MATTQCDDECYLWTTMTSVEQTVFVQCVVSPNTTRLEKGNDDEEYRVTSYSIDDVIGAATIESAKQYITNTLSVDNGDTQNMLVKLVNNNEAKLAMKLLIKMAASDEWRSFVQRSLNAECVGGGTLLHEAAKYGCIVDLREFITTDVLSNLRPNDKGNTLLHLAAGYGHAKDVEVLLTKSVVSTVNKKGWTPLHFAVSNKRPSFEIVSSLIQHVLMHYPVALNAQNYGYKNTALHLVSCNTNVDEKLLNCFVEADPTICNAERHTPLHLAAELEHDSQRIAALLELFLPRMSGNNFATNLENNYDDTLFQNEPCSQIVSLKGEMGSSQNVCENIGQPRRQTKLFYGGKSHIDTLLRLCAKNGHRDAVGLLLQNGADPKYVLHDIVDESVKRPDKIPKLLAVYEAIVENVIVPDSRWLAEDVDDNMVLRSDNYIQARRQRIIELVEEPNRFGKNVIERAIESGAKDMLLAILNTPDVYRIDGVGTIPQDCGAIVGDRIQYDVTNMIPSTMSGKHDTHCCCRSRVSDVSVTKGTQRPAKSYMELITEHDSIWREHDILQMEPFKKLTKSYVGVMRRVYLSVGFIHLAYITCLSVGFLPRKCWLNEQFALNLSDCNTTNDGDFDRDLNWGWLIWPGILLIFQLFSFLSYMISVCRTVLHLNRERRQYVDVRNVGGETGDVVLKILYKLVDKVLFYAFSAMTIYWYIIWPTRSDVIYNQYLEVTSMVFLFGWLLLFVVFSRVTRGTYVLSLVLKSVMVRDILLNFAPVFLIIVIAFTCTFYALQLTLLDHPMDFGETLYEIFATAFTLGNLYDYTIDQDYLDAGGNRGFLKAVYVAYLSLTALILFNYLIAMMSHRYEKDIPHAENAWRFDCVTDVLQVDKQRFLTPVLSFIHRFNYWCLFLCSPNCKQFYTGSGNRFYTTVPRWRPWLKNSDNDD